MINKHVSKTPFNFSTTTNKKRDLMDNTLKRGNDGCHINQLCVSVSPVAHSHINHSPADQFLREGSVRSVSKPIPTRANSKRQAQIKNDIIQHSNLF